MYTKVVYDKRACCECNELFLPNRKDKLFCSKSCYRKNGTRTKGHSTGKPETRNRRQYKKRKPYTVYKGIICSLCSFVPTHPCQLDVDHIDGNHFNNNPENLQTLCANCHRLKTAIQLGWLK